MQIETVGDYPEEILRERYEGRYYPLFEVAVRYLVVTRTPQRSPSDLLGVFERMGTGERFSASLSATVGLSAAEFEQDYFSLMQAWLAGDSHRLCSDLCSPSE
ncbi:MAG: hypothetical protein WBG01_11450 [Bacteroidota bacterium]